MKGKERQEANKPERTKEKCQMNTMFYADRTLEHKRDTTGKYFSRKTEM